MSLVVPQLLEKVIGLDSFRNQLTVLGLMAIVLLLVLLVISEARQVVSESDDTHSGRVLNIAIIPLLFVFAVIVIENLYRWIFL